MTSLRRSFARFAGRRLRWTVDEDQIVLVPDVMVGLVELCRTIAAPGEAVAFATPAYPPFFGALPHAGVKLVNVGLLADGSLDLDGLDAVLAAGVRALVLASPHNPTGRVLPRSELEAIAERCAAHEVWVLADEIHAPLTLPGATHVPWLEVSDAARRWGVTVTSASKAFNLAALKAALIVTADPAARDLVARMAPLHEHAGLLGVIAAEAAFDDGDPWLDAVIAQLDANRDQLGRDLARDLPDIAWRPPAGDVSRLARLHRSRPRRRARRDLPSPGARRARPRPRLRRPRRGPRPPELRHESGAPVRGRGAHGPCHHLRVTEHVDRHVRVGHGRRPAGSIDHRLDPAAPRGLVEEDREDVVELHTRSVRGLERLRRHDRNS